MRYPLSLPAAIASILISTSAASAAGAQDALIDAKSASHVRGHYLNDLDTMHVKILALANAIPAEKYGWRPAAGVRSISEAFMHVAGEWYYFTPLSVGGKAPDNFGAPREALPRLEKIATKAEVIAELEKSWAHCRTQILATDPAMLTGTLKPWGVGLTEAAFGMSGDLHEHLGQLISYSRSVGVKPPWSK